MHGYFRVIGFLSVVGGVVGRCDWDSDLAAFYIIGSMHQNLLSVGHQVWQVQLFLGVVRDGRVDTLDHRITSRLVVL